MINVLVTGSDGQLGSAIKLFSENYDSYNFYFANSTKLDITKHEKVKKFIEKNKIKIIINCAAFTRVKEAELNFDLANAVNNLAVANIAQISKHNKIFLIHISTDYVFDGLNYKGYTEIDITNPKTIYGKTKLNGELALIKINPINSIIIRTSWLYSNSSNNFVGKILNIAKHKSQLNIVNDQIGSPTNTNDLANAILSILPKISNKNVEIYHYSNNGSCSRYDFAKHIFKSYRIKTKLNSIQTSEYPEEINRPPFSVLDSTKIKNKFNLKILHWEESFNNILKNKN